MLVPGAAPVAVKLGGHRGGVDVVAKVEVVVVVETRAKVLALRGGEGARRGRAGEGREGSARSGAPRCALRWGRERGGGAHHIDQSRAVRVLIAAPLRVAVKVAPAHDHPAPGLVVQQGRLGGPVEPDLQAGLEVGERERRVRVRERGGGAAGSDC